MAIRVHFFWNWDPSTCIAQQLCDLPPVVDDEIQLPDGTLLVVRRRRWRTDNYGKPDASDLDIWVMRL